MKISPKQGLIFGVAAITTLSFGALAVLSPVAASGLPTFCNPFQPGTLMCNNFLGLTFYKDQTPWATFNRYIDPNGPVGAAQYINTGTTLKLHVNSLSRADNYTNADISTNVINAVNPFLRFGVDTRAEVRMRYSPNYFADPTIPNSAKGSAGFLLWNYFSVPIDPEPPASMISKPRDVFGFAYQDQASTIPGFKAYAIAEGQFAMIDPQYQMDLSQWHTYTIERRHTSVTFLVDGVQIAQVPLNQPGALTLPDENGLAMDVWSDNATYIFTDPVTITATLAYNHIDAPQGVEIQYEQATHISE